MHALLITALVPLLSTLASSQAVASSAAATAAASSTPSPLPGNGSGGGSSPLVDGACLPRYANGSYDQTAPCVALVKQSANCLLVADGAHNSSSLESDASLAAAAKRLFNGTLEQQCICEPNQPGSGYFQNVAGCVECQRLHGDAGDWFPVQLVPSASSSYCALTSPTVNVAGFLAAFVGTASTPALGTSTVTDVLGSSTAVSDYFTYTSPGTGGLGSTTTATATATPSGSAGPGGSASGAGALAVSRGLIAAVLVGTGLINL